ncbi:MAG: pyruvate kinase [Thermoleophilia bacterium]
MTQGRRTKIIATVGPASESDAVLRDMMLAGMDVVRLNLSHGTLEAALDLHGRIRRVAASVGRTVGTLVDLPGPKLRAGSFGSEGVDMTEGHRVHLVPGEERSTGQTIQVDYPDLLTGIEVGDRVSFGDGAIDMTVVEAGPDRLEAVVTHGGRLRGRPGVHVPSERLRVSTPTPDDLRILDAFIDADVDMVALSFVRSAHDVRRLGTEPHPNGPLVVAKIETRSAVDNIGGILDAAGAVMVARGDLGIDCPIEELPHLQKRIIRACIAHGRPAITATQMLESMVNAPSPTRAEASDVVNAVFDGSSAVMLSGETAVGRDPVNVVATMARLCAQADAEFDVESWNIAVARLHGAAEEGDTVFHRVTDTMTDAAWRVARELGANAILCLTRSGFTVRAIARFRPSTPILAFSPDERVRRQLTISWGATSIVLPGFGTNQEMVREAVAVAKDAGHLRGGDIAVVLAGDDARSPATNVLRVVHVT